MNFLRNVLIASALICTTAHLAAQPPEWANNDKKGNPHWTDQDKGNSKQSAAAPVAVADSGSGIMLLGVGLGTVIAMQWFQLRRRQTRLEKSSQGLI